MSVSDRYRELTDEVRFFSRDLDAASGPDAGRELTQSAQAAELLEELQERVGEIPRIRLEAELTPVLLKAHNRLDRARLLLEEKGVEDKAAAAWELEQKIYRLLNDL
jgi:hypothetical protein